MALDNVMANGQINRIRTARMNLGPLPEPPVLSAIVKGRVVTRDDLAEIDTAMKRWWERVQHKQIEAFDRVAEIKAQVNSAVSAATVTAPVQGTIYGTIGIEVDGGGNPLTPGRKNNYLQIPFPLKIISWGLFGNTVGNLVWDIWRTTLADFPPTALHSICGTNKPTLSNQQYATGSAAGWNAELAKDNMIAFHIDSVNVIANVSLFLQFQRLMP